jgi:hypothetical protein
MSSASGRPRPRSRPRARSRGGRGADELGDNKQQTREKSASSTNNNLPTPVHDAAEDHDTVAADAPPRIQRSARPMFPTVEDTKDDSGAPLDTSFTPLHERFRDNPITGLGMFYCIIWHLATLCVLLAHAYLPYLAI